MKRSGPDANEQPRLGTDDRDPAAAPPQPPLTGLLADAVDSLGARDDSAPWSAAITSHDRARLTAVIERRRGRANLDIAFTADLVEAVLPEALASLVSGPTARRRLAERIAGTLLDDPVAAARLQTLVMALRLEDGAADDGVPQGASP